MGTGKANGVREMSIRIENSATRLDCERDNIATVCRNASTLAFNVITAKCGRWIMYEIDNHKNVGRVICRVTCQGVIYLEVAQLAEDLTFAYIRWIEPFQVREIKITPPAHLLAWITADDWSPATVHRDLASGSHMARDLDRSLAASRQLDEMRDRRRSFRDRMEARRQERLNAARQAAQRVAVALNRDNVS